MTVETSARTLSDQFARDGYVILDGALSAHEVDELRVETLRICRGELGEIKGGSDAGASLSDDEVMRRYLCIHYPHKLSALMLEGMRHPVVVDALTHVIGPDVKAMQSMLFIKAEGKPGQAWHQDEFFIPTRDRSLTAAWIALDDATVENGCLWVLPGSHRRGVIFPNREHNDPRYDCTVESFDFPYTDADAVPVEIPAGSVLLFNGYLLHKSLPNTGGRGYRRALVNHYMSATSLLPWGRPAEGQPMAQADFRDVVLVAGEDPYAYKGIEQIRQPYIRPDRAGGCDR
ncbi:phytanoyl-CoA dioxygenase family protein [Phytoactinopolyspora alkaliphila]|uniref:Phytanoyl-CoA dioxygenase family protein n=1 Tax=Phytoactinopolyspora alkaliphila TaxID=1783498 RepID=A0A6N9YFK1_9ACTN|nr:phytanoyl-CoA dioxygenase family protein [Phytoactinopolyspora alkaliphila]NED93754.1 phytanoyl-CoA dioxygenase family protein [Phytoactinopolyspora alkaliphila]